MTSHSIGDRSGKMFYRDARLWRLSNDVPFDDTLLSLLPTPLQTLNCTSGIKMLSRQVVSASSRASLLRRPAPIASTIARTYATPATDSKPPIALYGLDGTYASALVRNALVDPELLLLLTDSLELTMSDTSTSTPQQSKPPPWTRSPNRSRPCPKSSRKTSTCPRSSRPRP